LVNGGFETMDDGGRFAAGWNSHQWGPQNARGYARIDKMNAHEGDRSLVINANDAGAKPGAFASLARPLEPGRYTISMWVCADAVMAGALVLSLDGVEAPAVAVGEDWMRTVVTIDLAKRASPAALRIWSTSARVRMWVDDVDVRQQ
jgi:hypothetical protein